MPGNKVEDREKVESSHRKIFTISTNAESRLLHGKEENSSDSFKKEFLEKLRKILSE